MSDSTVPITEESAVRSQRQTGFYVSTIHGFILLMLLVALSVGVGVVVHFAGSQGLVCRCDNTPEISTPEAMTQMCIDMTKKGAGEKICDVCSDDSPASTPPSTPASTDTPLNYRLPISTRPYLYTLVLYPNIYGENKDNFDFQGNVKIDTVAEDASMTITFHAHPSLNIDNSSLRVWDGNTSSLVGVAGSSYEAVREFYTLHLAQRLVVGHLYQIDISFGAPLSDSGTGLYFAQYDENGQTVYLATTKFEAPHARKAFPCFDEPALKAQFDITLLRREGGGRNYTALSNAPRLKTEPASNGMVAETFERTVMMSTYLLAFIVCDYEYLEDIASGVTYRTFAMPKKIQYADKAQMHGIKMFNRLSEYFQPAYVYDKLDNIVIPDFVAGATESWGLIPYREALLYEPGVSSASDENWIAEVIAHEISHMWFGNLVSPKWWSWLWLNEGFASFLDYHIVAEIYPSWKMLDINVAASTHGVMSSDSLTSSHPLTADVMSPGDISSIFDSVTYSKGAAIVRMMHLVMGQDLFIKGLNRYLATNAFGNAEHNDLWKALTEEAQANSVDLDMTEIMDSWVTQMNYPVVHVTVGSGTVTLTQERFLSSGGENPDQDAGKYGYKWTIPITYTTSDNVKFTSAPSDVHYFKYSEDSLELNVDVPNGGWILVNIQECGFFRVNYDTKNWNNIISTLSSNHKMIDPINRAQIINDAWNLAKAGMLDQVTALRTVNYLSTDLDYAPWRAFSRELGYVDAMLERTQLYGMFEDFMKKTVSIPFTALGTNITEDMAPIEKIEISQMVSLACNYDYEDCVDTAVRLFSIWMGDHTNNPIYPDLRSTLYCTAVRHGSQAHWQFVYERYHTEQTSSEKDRLRQALSCTREPWLLQRVLEMSLNSSEVKGQDVLSTVTYVANSRWGRELAWNFVKHHFARLGSAITTRSGLYRVIQDISEKYNTEQEYKKVEDFMNSGDDVSEAGTAFKEVLDRTTTNINWLTKNYVVFETWLKS
ncbi:aminopeptidase Ey-like [Haliotis rufescens]|uniref:aminopeptidase Ey-like n=1 Tax=Haliotis rufescens TaxID=6454 RepID=UPI00201F4DA3|nr:aminopeptidase Ey-like [Haliotis rufescens]